MPLMYRGRSAQQGKNSIEKGNAEDDKDKKVAGSVFHVAGIRGLDALRMKRNVYFKNCSRQLHFLVVFITGPEATSRTEAGKQQSEAGASQYIK
jgi:hypothetical protein